jgi:hypothetical protein
MVVLQAKPAFPKIIIKMVVLRSGVFPQLGKSGKRKTTAFRNL